MPLPDSPTSLQEVIPSYLYQEYSDDENLQAFFTVFNGMAQDYVDWFNGTPLPVYTSPAIAGALLDWVGEGVYDIARPALPFGTSTNVVTGPFNTIVFDSFVFNGQQVGVRGTGEGIGQFAIGIGAIGVGSFAPVSDDVYRRVLTWDLQKGDGKYFSIPWLKRRVAQFLYGTNGIIYNVDETYSVGVTFDVNQCLISIPASAPMAAVFQAAVQTGVLELPFLYTFVVNLV